MKEVILKQRLRTAQYEHLDITVRAYSETTIDTDELFELLNTCLERVDTKT